MSNVVRFSALKGFPVNWESVGLKDVGIPITIQFETDCEPTKEYMEYMAKFMEEHGRQNGIYLYNVRPIFKD